MMINPSDAGKQDSQDINDQLGDIESQVLTPVISLAPYISPVAFDSPSYLCTSAWLEHAPFAFWVTKILQSRTMVELGSHNGFSYFSFCQEVKKAGLDTRCFAVDTWQGDEHSEFYGEEVFEAVTKHNDLHYSAFSRLIRSTFEQAITYFPDASIDLLHIDGRHFYDDVKYDFESWLPKLSDRAIVLFHDTNVRERSFGVYKFWAELSSNRPHFEFYHGHGLGVLGVGKDLPAAILPLFSASTDQLTSTSIRLAYGRLGSAVLFSYRLNDMQAKLDRCAAEITTLVANESARGHEIVELGNRLNLQSIEHSKREAELRAIAEAERHKIEVDLQALIDSTSWKITMPFRVLKRLARQLFIR